MLRSLVELNKSVFKLDENGMYEDVVMMWRFIIVSHCVLHYVFNTYLKTNPQTIHVGCYVSIMIK